MNHTPPQQDVPQDSRDSSDLDLLLDRLRKTGLDLREIFNEPEPVAPIDRVLPSPDIPTAWATNAARLAEWAQPLSVQKKVFGQYLPMQLRTKDKQAYTNRRPLTFKVFEKHFAGRDVSHLIGVHSTVRKGDRCWSIMLVGDIDRHKESTDPAITLKAALTWYERTRQLGFTPLLIDSNGAGGYHLFIIFDSWVETRVVYQLGQSLFRDWNELGLSEKPETFPKQPEIPADKWGNWIRLPGRHHTRNHWSNVWDGHQWLEGIDAIEWILQIKGTSAEMIPAEVRELQLTAPRKNRTPTNGVCLEAFHRLVTPRNGRVTSPLVMDTIMDTISNVPMSPLEKRVELVRKALTHIPNNDLHYDQWCEIGMSLAELGEEGRKLFHVWSATSKKYDQQTTDDKFDSFKPGDEIEDGKGLTLGTLFDTAKKNGFEFPASASSSPEEILQNPIVIRIDWLG